MASGAPARRRGEERGGMRRLNLFQAMMLRWRELYPYSAVHAVRVDQPLNATRLESIAAAMLEERGLTGLELDARGGRCAWHGGPAGSRLHVVPASDDAPASLDSEIERQLNVPFTADGKIDPFRFFAVNAGPSFYLALAYDHVVAGGDSVARLLNAVVDRYEGATVAAEAAGSPYAPGYARLFWREKRALLAGLGALPRLAADCRRAVRPRYAAPEDGYNAFTRFTIDAAAQATLGRVAAAWKVSQQDLWLAIALLALSPLAAARASSPRRREIALASILNIRHELGSAAADAFGPCLASFRVAHVVPPGVAPRELALAVHAQTDAIKRRKLYLQTLLATALAGFEWRFLSRARRLRFFAKHYPVSAGVTPLNVNALWRRDGRREPPPYVRAISTGPLAPMILGVTASGPVLNVGITFRTTVYSRDAVEGVAAGMLAAIGRLEAEAP